MISDLLKWLCELFTWFFTVAPWEQAIRVRAGKHIKLLDAGFYVRIPFVDRVYKQSTRRRIHSSKVQTLTTLDGHVLTCSSAVGFEIKDLYVFFNTLESPNDTIECEVAGLVTAYVSKRRSVECLIGELEKYVSENLHLEKYGLASQEYYVISLATAKAYRLITDELPGWNRDDLLRMEATH
jgi:hypothetical protein